jgi:hypothetical protein
MREAPCRLTTRYRGGRIVLDHDEFTSNMIKRHEIDKAWLAQQLEQHYQEQVRPRKIWIERYGFPLLIRV